MKTTKTQSIYSMLVRSQENERSLSECAVYGLLLVSTVFSIWQAAVSPVTVPVRFTTNVAQVAMVESDQA